MECRRRSAGLWRPREQGWRPRAVVKIYHGRHGALWDILWRRTQEKAGKGFCPARKGRIAWCDRYADLSVR
ncbi:hypothetical protein GCM10010342_60110 [Streptomyces anulatus]|nr:hypothetical protein GCM10010342_60110 [Streptomyces anulatus]